MTVAVPRGRDPHRGAVDWRVFTVRRASSGQVVARARIGIAGSTSKYAPTLMLLQAPPPTATAGAIARLRFSVSRAHVSCSLDTTRYRPCSSGVSFAGLSAGAHTATIRARNSRGRSSLTVRWTVRAPSSGAAPSDGGEPTTSTAPADPPQGIPSPPGAAGRRLVYEDHFDGTAVDTTRWSPYNSAGNAGNGLRRPSALSIDGEGHLVITASMADGQIVSGGMSNRLNLTYGYFEFRVRTEVDPTGTMSGVVLTWPQSGRWPQDGENDIYETNEAVNTRRPFYSFVHYGLSNQQYYFRHDADGSEWHTMAMDWSPTAIRIYRDGALVWTLQDPAAIPHVAHHLDIQLDAKATRTLTTPVRMYVDDVRIYE
jgi:Glycosyl hydrolases family 16